MSSCDPGRWLACVKPTPGNRGLENAADAGVWGRKFASRVSGSVGRGLFSVEGRRSCLAAGERVSLLRVVSAPVGRGPGLRVGALR